MNSRPPLSALVLALVVPVSAGASTGHETAMPAATASAHPAPADAAGHAEAAHGGEPAPAGTPAGGDDAAHAAEERASLLRIGDAKLASGDLESALLAYNAVATATEDPDELATALLGLARTLRKSGEGVKAAATYERLLKDHPGFVETPSALLELGRTYRELGSPKLAIARFYSVINSTLRLPEAETVRYRRTVRTAQFEIAETHLSTGDYASAIKFFNRLDLLDLAPADRARARFKAAEARVLAGESLAAVTALRTFIEQEPGAAQNPEARFLLGTLLARLGRHEDSLQVTLELLRHEHARTAPNAPAWLAWQRRTGNQLANQFYIRNDFAGALLLFRALAALDASPEWRLPILYHIGLCEERLNQHGAALEAYREIGKAAGEKPAAAIADVARMAAWRCDQLAWLTRAQTALGELGPPLVPPPSPAVLLAPEPAEPAPTTEASGAPLAVAPAGPAEASPTGEPPAVPAAPAAPTL